MARRKRRSLRTVQSRKPSLQVPHFTDAPEKGCPLQAVHRRLNEFHYFWHKTAESYNDPETFHFNLNALIQAARNVTFALQSEKSKVPQFDRWYADWQKRMRADPVLRWVQDARNTVVKRGDLEGQSVAKMTVITSYAEPPALELPISPTTTLQELAAIAIIRALPEELKERGILVIERRWISNKFPSQEVLDALAYVYGFLFQIVADAHERCGSTMLVEWDRPSDYRLPCMVANELLRSLRINLRTGAILTPARLLVERDEREIGKVVRRYGIKEELPPTDDPFAYAEQLLEVAKRVLARDKTHIQLVMLHHHEGRWQLQVLAPDDPDDKLLMWRRIASDVEAYGYDAYIFIAEAWLHSIPNSSASGKKQRRRSQEALTVTVETANGSVRHWILFFRRRRGRIQFGKTHVIEDRPLFSEPVRQAWSRMFKAEDSQT